MPDSTRSSVTGKNRPKMVIWKITIYRGGGYSATDNYGAIFNADAIHAPCSPDVRHGAVHGFGSQNPNAL